MIRATFINQAGPLKIQLGEVTRNVLMGEALDMGILYATQRKISIELESQNGSCVYEYRLEYPYAVEEYFKYKGVKKRFFILIDEKMTLHLVKPISEENVPSNMVDFVDEGVFPIFPESNLCPKYEINGVK